MWNLFLTGFLGIVLGVIISMNHSIHERSQFDFEEKVLQKVMRKFLLKDTVEKITETRMRIMDGNVELNEALHAQLEVTKKKLDDSVNAFVDTVVQNVSEAAKEINTTVKALVESTIKKVEAFIIAATNNMTENPDKVDSTTTSFVRPKVDGNWAEWAAWTTCSVTCENGTQSRTRDCTNPAPSNGGLTCTGPYVDSKKCLNQLCPVHGNWSDWSTWSPCSVTCDVGLREKSRTCNNPKPDRNGDYCVGNPFQNTVCLQEPCSNRNGGWSSWGSWQSCSVTCGGGLKRRDRTCTSPSPTLYGKGCEGNSEAFAVCANTPCHAVAFRAERLNVLSNFVNAFPTVIFNEGNAYNPSTGHFTAPVDGIYYFTAQVTVRPNKSIVFYIQKCSTSMSGATTLTQTMIYNPISYFSSYLSSLATCSVKLTRNENVWVHMSDHYTTADINDDSWISFTGMLIQEL